MGMFALNEVTHKQLVHLITYTYSEVNRPTFRRKVGQHSSAKQAGYTGGNARELDKIGRGIEKTLRDVKFDTLIAVIAKATGTNNDNKSKNHVFWSGGAASQAAAETYALNTGGITLSQTPQGVLLSGVQGIVGYKEARPLWELASALFAKEASGEVHVFLNKANLASDSIWCTIEKPVLEANPNVTIVEHDILS